MMDLILFVLAAMQFAAIAIVGLARTQARLDREEPEIPREEDSGRYEPEIPGDQ